MNCWWRGAGTVEALGAALGVGLHGETEEDRQSDEGGYGILTCCYKQNAGGLRLRAMRFAQDDGFVEDVGLLEGVEAVLAELHVSPLRRTIELSCSDRDDNAVPTAKSLQM